MPLRHWLERAEAIPGAPGMCGTQVNRDEWLQAAREIAAAGGRLLALWATAGGAASAAADAPDGADVPDAPAAAEAPDRLDAQGARGVPHASAGADLYAAFLVPQHVLVLGLDVTAGGEPYPSIHELFPAAARMQRAAFDLCGVRSTDDDTRPWLRHAAWPAQFHPLRNAGALEPPQAAAVGAHVAAAASVGALHGNGNGGAPAHAPALDAYEFVRVQGDGVHEIAVGPVHAGIIEPGHFRFSVVGEKVLRLEERLGYVHKGIERRFTELPILQGHRLAARISGDSAVAFSWAYCQALEGMSGCEIPVRAAWLRALYLEIERSANHLGDLGALGNDAGFAFGLAQFSRLKELLLRATDAAFGQRYLFDAIVPGGVAFDLTHAASTTLRDCVAQIAAEAVELRDVYDNHAGVRDRFVGAGRVTPELAARLGLIGLAGRASGQAFDARSDLPCAPYAELKPARIVSTGGDVAARVAARFDELAESCRLVQRIVQELAALREETGGDLVAPVAAPAAHSFGVGLIEGWRGPVLVALEAGAAGTIRRCHPHDPSWQNWPVLEHAIVDNIVPDFPLINKSFNLSYSGHDL